MKLPFFRSKVEPTAPEKLLVAPPRPVAHPTPVAPTTSAPRNLEDTVPLNPGLMMEVNQRPQSNTKSGPSVSLHLRSILSQLPPQIFAPTAQQLIASATIAIPLETVLPQLSTGRVSIRLSELLRLIPADALQRPLPVVAGQQAVILPLPEIVAALPSESLATHNEIEVTVDTTESVQMPKLFDDALLQEPIATQAVHAAPAVIAEPEAAAPVTASAPTSAVAETPATVSTETVMVSLRALVAVMPDRVFCCPRADLWRRVNLDLRAALPLDPIVSQLRTARVRLPLLTVIQAMPPSMFISPLPELKAETIPIPLDEIVPQLPPRLFHPFPGNAEQEELRVDESDIPAPFHERNAPEPVVEQQTEVFEPEPAPVNTFEIDEEPAEALTASQLDDEGFDIFTERAEPAEARAVEPPVAETPTVEAVATPEPEPVAEARPRVEPQPEPTLVVTPAEVACEQRVEPSAPAVKEPVSAFDEKQLLVNVNECTVDDLQQIPGIGPALARRIVEFRDSRGSFATVEELKQIPGVGPKLFRALSGPKPYALNRLLGVAEDRQLTLQEVVSLTSALPGIAGCIVAMSDGLYVTGELPAHLNRDTVSVFAPQLFKKVGHYVRELRVGQVSRITLFTDRQPMTIFHAGDVYLIVIHDARRFSKALLRRCERISQEIARLCRRRAVV